MCPAPPGGTGHGEPDWAGHEARAGHLADARTPSGQSVFAERMASWQLTSPLSELHDVPNEVAASFVLLMIRDAARGRPDLDFGFGEVVYRSIRAAIGRRHLVLPAHEAAWAAVTAANSAPLRTGAWAHARRTALCGRWWPVGVVWLRRAWWTAVGRSRHDPKARRASPFRRRDQALGEA